MSASTGTITSATSVPSTSGKYGRAFWDLLWGTSGIGSVLFFVIAFILSGVQPHVHASSDALTAFYAGDRTRILIAAPVFGLAILNLMWFAAAIRAALADAGQDGWGAAATAASAAAGGLLLLFGSVVAALAYSIAGSGNAALASGMNDLACAVFVLSSFPRAMLVMAPTFGFWRAGLISNALFGTGVGVVVLGVLGGTTWASGGFWAPDGAYARYIWPGISLVWILVLSRVLLSRRPATHAGW